jgi:hypothetical protein
MKVMSRLPPTSRISISGITPNGLIVADGAMLPTPTIHNPSHTIAALAERLAAHAS